MTADQVKELKMAAMTPKPTRQVGGEHYAEMELEPIQVIEAWSKTWPPHLVYHFGNVVKYVGRCGRKNGVSMREDLLKAIHYLERAVELSEGK